MGSAGEAGLGIVQFLEGADLSRVLGCFLDAAETIRWIHESGQVHGGLSAATIIASESGVWLLNSLLAPEDAQCIAPEVRSGSPPDQRSDIFSFACVLESAVRAVPGSTLLDPLLTRCFATNPAERFQRMQQVIVELKLLRIITRQQEWRGFAHYRRLENRIRTLISRVETLERRLESGSPQEVSPQAPSRQYWFPGRTGRGFPAAPARGEKALVRSV
jgi:hypothetical protein